MSFLETIDLLGKSFKFNYNGSEYKSIEGGILTILLGIGYIIFTGYFGKDLVLKESPKVIIGEKILDKNPMVVFNSSVLFFGFGIFDLNDKVINDPRYFDYNLEYLFFKIKPKGIKEILSHYTLPTEQCSSKHMDNTTLYKENMHAMLCVNFNDTVGGTYSKGVIGVPYFWAFRCNNATESKYNITCATPDEFNRKFNGGVTYAYIYQKNLLDPKDYSDSVKRSFHLGFRRMKLDFTSNQYHRNEFIYNTAILVTDSGVIRR